MRKLTLILSLIFFSLLPASAENNYEIIHVKKIEANPINVAIILTEKSDSSIMASICEYYGYINQPSQDDFTIFKHPNGSIIRYNFTTADNGKKYPTVEVTSNDSQKEKDQKLQQLNFQKIGNHYERKSIGYQTQCRSGSNVYLRFSNHPQPKAQ